MWEMEDQKVNLQKHLARLSELAKGVYKLNDERAKLKLKINKLTNSNIREITLNTLNISLMKIKLSKYFKKTKTRIWRKFNTYKKPGSK